MTARGLPTRWTCNGYGPPDSTPCKATGTTAASAEKHASETGHATVERVGEP